MRSASTHAISSSPSGSMISERPWTQVVLLALEQRDRQREPERIEQGRQVALEQLILQRARTGRDDHALVRLGGVQCRRQQVRERLADPVGASAMSTPPCSSVRATSIRECALPGALLPLGPAAR
jgi:hypothetical protein